MSTTSTIGRAVERILEMIRLEQDTKVLFVKYEDLCLNPELEMKRIYDYLGVEQYQHDFENINQITKEDDEVYGLTSDLHQIRTQLSMQQPDYKQILGQDICNWLYQNYTWYFEKFNYRK